MRISRGLLMEMSEREWHYLQLFHRFSGVAPLFCMDLSQALVFVVPTNEIPKVIGKGGMKIRQLSKRMGKNIVVLPEADSAEAIINHFFNGNIKALNKRPKYWEVTVPYEKRAMMIGRDGYKIKALDAFMRKRFGIGVRVR